MTMQWVLLIFLCGVSAQHYETSSHQRRQLRNTTTTPRPQDPLPPQQHYPQNGQIEYRLTRLEVLLVEKLENLRSEVRENSRRLQALEWQSTESHATLEGLKSDLNRFTTSSPDLSSLHQDKNGKLEQRIDNLSKGVQILVVATRNLNSDVNVMRRNMSEVINDTKSLLHSATHLVTKQFLNNELLDLKHHQIHQRSWQDSSCPSSTPSSSTSLPRSCKDVLESGQKRSGLYRIHPEHSSQGFMVVCELQTRGGGWTVIQNRYDGSQDFYLSWHDYKHGFGNLGGEFWLGLDNIHQLTGYEVNELIIELQDMEFQNKTAQYAAFSVGPEIEGFPLKILGGYRGDAGDSLTYHAGGRFSTKDMDQDSWPEGSCAQAHGGGWWYRNCDMSNLNGRYLSGELPEQYTYQGMYWGEFRGAQYSLLKARMMVRPRTEQVNQLLLDEIFNEKIVPLQ